MNLFRALRSRNYRLYFSGQLFSLIGTWMQNIALSWYIYRLTSSSFYLGLVGFLNMIPTFFLTPFAGVVADHFDKKRLLLLTQTLSMIQALLLAFLVLTGKAQVWNIMALSFFLGVVNAFDAPARQSFVVKLVDKKEDLSNAIALNSAMFNSARLLGPSIAGLLISLIGEGMCFLFNGISYIAVLAALNAMRFQPFKKTKVKVNILRHLKDGIKYSFENKTIRYSLLIVAFFSIFGFSYAVVMPVVVKKILHGEAHILGFIMGGAGTGAILAALTLAQRKKVKGLWNWMVVTSLITSLALAVLSISTTFLLTIITVAVLGYCMILLISSANTLIQNSVEENKRGIVMSFYTLAFIGMAPIGSLFTGTMSHILDTQWTLLINAGMCLLFSILFLLAFIRRMRTANKKALPIVTPSQEEL